MPEMDESAGVKVGDLLEVASECVELEFELVCLVRELVRAWLTEERQRRAGWPRARL